MCPLIETRCNAIQIMTVRARPPAVSVRQMAPEVYQYYCGSRPSNKLINEKIRMGRLPEMA